jgi:hypothetical protein
MKKIIKLYNKKVMLKTGVLQPEQEVELRSIDFIKGALEGNAENLKGLERVYRIATLMDNIKKQAEQGDTLVLDDPDYLTIKDSCDKLQQWGFVVLHFREFVESILNAEKVEG